MIFRRRELPLRGKLSRLAAKTTKHEEVNTEYSLTSGELFAAEKA